MVTREILNSHTVATLKKEIGKVKKELKVTGKKKSELVDVMLKNKNLFSHIKYANKITRKTPVTKSKASKPSVPTITVTEEPTQRTKVTKEVKSKLPPLKEKPMKFKLPKKQVKINPSIVKEQLEKYEDLKKKEKKYSPLFIYPDSKVKDFLKKNIISRISVDRGLNSTDFDVVITLKDGKERTMKPTRIEFKGDYDFKESKRREKEEKDKIKKQKQSELDYYIEQNKNLRKMTQKKRDETLLEMFKSTDISNSEEWHLVKKYASKKTFIDIIDNQIEFLKDQRDLDEKQIKSFGKKEVRKMIIDELNKVNPTGQIEKREKAKK